MFSTGSSQAAGATFLYTLRANPMYVGRASSAGFSLRVFLRGKRQKPGRGESHLKRFVLDASVALRWFLDDSVSPYANRIKQFLI